MHYFEKEEVISLLDMPGCVGLMRETLRDYSAGRAIQILRSVMSITPRKLMGLMPAANTATGIAGAKIITVFPVPAASSNSIRTPPKIFRSPCSIICMNIDSIATAPEMVSKTTPVSAFDQRIASMDTGKVNVR